MKIDLQEKSRQSVKRVTHAFFTSLYTLLSQKSFESISVQELCEKAQYPRATFYNYFEDKYDLMYALWLYDVSEKVHMEERDAYEPYTALTLFFDRFCDLIEEHREAVNNMLYHNGKDGFFLSSFRSYLNTSLLQSFEHCPNAHQYKIPFEVLAQHYANTIFLVLEWLFMKQVTCTRQQAFAYLTYLLDQLIQIGCTRTQ